MASRLSDCLVRDGTVTSEVVRAATARQAVYGGALDTALLELGAVDEPTLWSTLATATGIPIPDPALFENPDPTAALRFDASWSRRCRAVPVGQHSGRLQVCCAEPLALAELAAVRAALGLELELFVVPEVRLAAARQAVYGEPMPPRLLRVLARLLGAQPVRRWVHALTPTKAQAKAPSAAAPDPGAAFASSPAESLKDLEGDLAEAEFDVPVNTAATDPHDILESRPSRASTEQTSGRQAADEVARALSLGAPDADGAPAPAPAAGSGSFTDDEKIDTSPGRAAALAGAEAVPRTAENADTEATVAPLAKDAAKAAAPVVDGRRPAPPDALTEEQENQLCLVAEDVAAAARLAALRVLRSRLDRGRVRALADKLRGELTGPVERAVPAAGALGELRDGQAVPALIEALQGPAALAQTAARALLEIAQQDFGQSRKKWLTWWETHKGSERADWLLEGLSHKSPEIRFASSEELRLVTGEYFGYHFDLPKKEREEARERWQTWWRTEGRARAATRS
jgi:hypothetical protein